MITTTRMFNGKLMPLEAGCWIDGHNGQYGIDRLASIFDDLVGTEVDGQTFGQFVQQLRTEIDRGNDRAGDTLGELYDELTDGLNDHTIGGYWEWIDGELFLVDNDDLDDEDGE
jgi:hypothetical protein